MAQAIISPNFCSPHPVDLGIVKLVPSGNFSVKDVNGNIVFNVTGTFLSLRRFLVDGAGNPIVTLQKKLPSTHHRWEVYRGDNTDSRNLVFSVKKSSVVQWKTNLHVFLANNEGESAPDFKVKGSWFEQSCVVYAGKSNSSNILAQMHKKHTVTSVLFMKDNFRVTVSPGVDQALIIALIFILHEINSGGSSSGDSV
ncbi:PREDICTED: protein LURP-one-related 15-like [Fragaria vesca subsp. vesca]|uniref:protein LURP-one-related 15-like n=1 Tax=Fragaria vesca subsp. vesca TaxID=101020 RepID=UPI0002C33FF1|nr:PREDICTED: protein LURP-one-related 15-like [Fragaria vesca subsp. vesca]